MLKKSINKNYRVRRRLFDPYENGLCAYDLAFLSLRTNKKKNLKIVYTNQYKKNLLAS